jgi:hypothetical protein
LAFVFADENDTELGREDDAGTLSQFAFFAAPAASTTIPEPASLALFGSGLLGLGFWAGKRGHLKTPPLRRGDAAEGCGTGRFDQSVVSQTEQIRLVW